MLASLLLKFRDWSRYQRSKRNPPREIVDFSRYAPEIVTRVEWHPNRMAPESSGMVYALVRAPSWSNAAGRVRIVIRKCHINRKTGKWVWRNLELWGSEFFYRPVPLHLLKAVNDRKAEPYLTNQILLHGTIKQKIANIEIADKLGRPPGVWPCWFMALSHERRVANGWVKP